MLTFIIPNPKPNQAFLPHPEQRRRAFLPHPEQRRRAFLSFFLSFFLRKCVDKLIPATGNYMKVLLVFGLIGASCPSAFCQERFHIVTDCPCEYVLYLMGTPNHQIPLDHAHPIDDTYQFDPGTGQIAIKLIGCGVGIPPTSFPPVGSIINLDGSGCDCYVPPGPGAYTPNFQFGFNAETQTWEGKLTCIWHP